MDRSHPFLKRIRSVVRSLDDDALAALANKGLLRRAQKDLQAEKPKLVDVTEAYVRVRAADGTVEVPELPAKSRCSCPATGVCRHVLMTLLYLRDDPELAAAPDVPTQGELFTTEPASDGGPSPRPDGDPSAGPASDPTFDPESVLGDATDDDLVRWAGKPLVRKAAASLSMHASPEIQTAPSLVIRFHTRNVSCRWTPGGGLPGMMCSCRADGPCEHVVAAVLAYQVSLGRRTVTAEAAGLTESSGAPRTRAEVLESVSVVLHEMTALGLARVTESARDRLTTLAVSAHGVDLPRLERMLKTLADETALAIRRDAHADLPNLLGQAARVEALATALRREALPVLVGVHRTRYHEVGQITLLGVGAHHWRSKGGYHGLTVYFWDESRQAWSTWSESRPVGQAGFDPVGRFKADGPWVGCSAPQVAAGSKLRLTGAWRNTQGRISGRPSTRALVVGPTDLAEIPAAVTDWSTLGERIARVMAGGLAERSEHEVLVLLVPQAWGPPQYDSIRQELMRPIVDAAGCRLELWLPFSTANERAVELLERHDPQSTRAVFGALRWVAGTVRVQPISLIEADRIVSLNLEGVGKGGSAGVQKPAVSPPAVEPAEPEVIGQDVEEDDETPFDGVAAPAGFTELGRLLSTAEAEIEALAESGVAVRRDPELLQGIAKRLEQLGMTVCARSIARLTEQLGVARRSADGPARTSAAAALLRAYYVVRLAGEQEAVALAAGQLTK